MGGYVPSTSEEKASMLKTIGLSSFDELFAVVPKDMKVEKLDIPDGMSELELMSFMERVSAKNILFKSVFKGAGAYNHYIPSIVKSITSKEEFITSYTPYQAEISQGILQATFEFQTMISELTGMDAANASVYDGATAAAESVAMCVDRKRKKALISSTSNPMTIETIKTYAFGSGVEIELIPEKDGKTDIEALKNMIDNGVACVYIEQTNFYGQIEAAEDFSSVAHEQGAKFVMGVNPISSVILKTAAECGADIAVGEGQPLGIPLSFGGPYLGFMTCTNDMMRKLPGRIVGETVDNRGQRAFVLTLQAREQHIRREKASSNICSNQALCALTAAVYMTAMGPLGMQKVAENCFSKAHYAAEKISSLQGYSLKYKGEFFHEFVTNLPVDAKTVLDKLAEESILGGHPLDDRTMLWCVTEKNTKAEIDKLVEILGEVK